MVLADVFPGLMAELADDFVDAGARGCRVLVKVYRRLELEGIELLLQPEGERVFSNWPGEQLSLVVDAEEHLLALFDDDLESVHQALWSRSTFLSCLHHNHLAMEHLVTLYLGNRDVSLETADATVLDHLNISVLSAAPRGLERLRSRYGAELTREDIAS
jgi:hypothetical protein